MATAVYTVVLALTATRTALVLEAVCFSSSPVARVARAVASRGLSHVLPSTSPQQRSPSSGGSRVRWVAKRCYCVDAYVVRILPWSAEITCLPDLRDVHTYVQFVHPVAELRQRSLG